MFARGRRRHEKLKDSRDQTRGVSLTNESSSFLQFFFLNKKCQVWAWLTVQVLAPSQPQTQLWIMKKFELEHEFPFKCLWQGLHEFELKFGVFFLMLHHQATLGIESISTMVVGAQAQVLVFFCFFILPLPNYF